MEKEKKPRKPRKSRKKDIVKVNMDDVKILVEKGKDIIVTPEAEASILKLLALQEAVDAAVERMKAMIAEEGQKYNQNFTSIRGEQVKIMYREYGGKYSYDATRINDIPKTLYTPKVSISLITKEIDKWAEEHGGLPFGINEAQRSKTLSISLKKSNGEK